MTKASKQYTGPEVGGRRLEAGFDRIRVSEPRRPTSDLQPPTSNLRRRARSINYARPIYVIFLTVDGRSPCDGRFGPRSPRGGRRRRRVSCARRAASRDGVSPGLPVCRQPPRCRGHRAGRVHQGLPVARSVPLRRAVDVVAVPDRDERVHRPQAAAVAGRVGAVHGRGGVADGEYARRTGPDPKIRPTAGSSAKCWQSEIARLPPGQRLVFTMRHHEGLKLSEIASALGLAEGTVKRQLHAAVHRLRGALTSARVTTGGRA